MSELPLGWAEARLGELGTWSGGGTPSKRISSYWSGNIPWVSPKDMKVERIRDTIDHISSEAVEQSATKLVPASSVLVVTRSGILSHSLPVAVSDREVALNQDLKALVPDGVLSDYVAWALRSSAQAILRDCSKAGTTVSNIDTARMLVFQIPLAPLNEQRRIVAAIEEQFSRLDAADASLLTAASRVVGLRARTLNALTVLDGKRVSVGTVAEVQGGIQKQPKRRPVKHKFPFLRVANVLRGSLDLREIHEVELFSGEIERYALRAGDLLVVEGNGSSEQIGRSARWLGQIENCVHQNHLIRVRPGDGVEPAFLDLFWNAPATARSIAAVASTTSGLYTLSVTKVKSVEIVLPPLVEQRRIVAEVEERLSAVDALRAAVERAQKRSKALRRSILERAFRGELVPQDPSDEPAEGLLARIRAEREANAPPRKRRTNRAK